MRNSILLLVPALFCLQLQAQLPESPNAADIFLRLKKLKVLGSVLYVAAHPDDENTRLLAFLSKERLYRTGYLSMTRGDGGQNLIGDEQGVELGLIRTQELMAARRIDGAEQFFTRAYDFGFTKSTEEALRIWDKEKILSDVVWMIRRFQPDVVITRFPEDSRAGHGQHSASAVLAHEAFKAAADPNRFPEQLKYGVKPWQAKRLLWNTFVFGNTNTTSEDQFKMDVGLFNAILGKGYGEIAAESRSQHKSQGFGIPRSRGQAFEYFSTVEGDAPKVELTDGVPTDWSRVEGARNIPGLIDKIIENYKVAHPEESVPGLVRLYKELSGLKEGYWKTQKLKEVQGLVEACTGIWLEATTREPYVAQGDAVQVNLSMVSRLLPGIVIRHFSLDHIDTALKMDMEPNKYYSLSFKLNVSPSKEITQPFWLRYAMSAGSFNVHDQELIGNAESKPAFEASFQVEIEGQEFTCKRPLQSKSTDPVKGEVYQPLTILPVVTAALDPELTLFSSQSKKDIQVHLFRQGSHSGNPELSFTPTPGIDMRNEGNFHNSTYTFSATPGKNDSAVELANLMLRSNGKDDSAKELRTISYEHIPRIDYFRDAVEKFVVADVKTEGHRIGYIEGAGDKVPQALRQMGFEVVMLKEKDISPASLTQFDAIIAGVRAYDVHDWLSDKYEMLMDYVREGGNLIVQYNRNLSGGGQKLRIGPYPFSIVNGRVTDENAEVKFLHPEHQVLNFPNKITSRDFEGWIQERGIYFAGPSDSAYLPILAMHDPGESDQKGSLIIAKYGKGVFVYTGLVFFRELPAGVPGAFRLFANIIALNHKRGF